MDTRLVFAICCLLSYLAGSIPFGLVICRLKGVNIREVGSGNIGATNVFRGAGKFAGTVTFVLDFLKGYLPALLSPLALSDSSSEEAAAALRVASGCMAILGHNWPVFIGFKGGKGVATSAGVLLAIAWQALGLGLLCWLAVFLASGYVSAASITAALVIPAYAWLTRGGGDMLIPMALTAFGATAIARHGKNISRLVKGEENRFDFRKKRKKMINDEKDSCNW